MTGQSVSLTCLPLKQDEDRDWHVKRDEPCVGMRTQLL